MYVSHNRCPAQEVKVRRKSGGEAYCDKGKMKISLYASWLSNLLSAKKEGSSYQYQSSPKGERYTRVTEKIEKEGTMKLAITSECFRKALSSGKIDLFKFMEMAANEFKMDGVELENRDFQSRDPAYVNELKSKAETLSLEIINMGFFNDYGKPTREERDQELERFKQWLPVPKMLGAPSMRIFATFSGEPKLWDETISYVRESALLAEKEGIPLLIEPEGCGFPRDAETTLRLFREVNQDNLKLLLDTGNYVDGIPSIEKTLHFAFLVHFKFLKVDREGNEVNIDYDTVFDLLRKNGYDGYVTIEYEGEEDSFEVVPRVVSRIKRYLAAG